MGFNYAGFPVGAAISGVIAASSLGGAVALGIGACIAGGLFAAVLVPPKDPATERGPI